jgi:hypothetical protein
MTFDEQRVKQSFTFEHEQVQDLRTRWHTLIDLCVWGELTSRKVGLIPRLSIRLLELGECLRSLASDRSWLSQQRERVRGAMAASFNTRDALLKVDQAARLVDGGSHFAAFEQNLAAFRKDLLCFVEKHERLWSELLETPYDNEPGGS